jgi:hypothetical protein
MNAVVFVGVVPVFGCNQFIVLLCDQYGIVLTQIILKDAHAVPKFLLKIILKQRHAYYFRDS